jgi:hypothetical protein
MEILRTLVTTGDGDSDNDRLNNWPDDQPAEGIWFDMDMPVTVGGGGGTPGAADLVSALNHFLGIVNVSYKLGTEFRPFQGVDGGAMRTAHRVMTLREVWNDFVGVAAAGAPGAHVWHVRVYLTPHRQKAEGPRRLIGWTQGKTFEVTTQEQAGAFVAPTLVLSRTAGLNFNLRIVPAYCAGEDQFSHLPHYREVNRTALDVEGPDGTTLAFWDENAAGGGTAITNHSVKVGGRELVKQVTPTFSREQYAKNIDAGGSNIDDTVTPIYMADPFDDERSLPAGPVYFKMVAQDVATVMGRFLYWPPVSEQDAASVTKAAAKNSSSDVAAQLPAVGDSPESNGAQATRSLIFRRRDDQRFESEQGLVADKDGTQVVPFVPKEKQALGAAMKASNPALLRRHQKLIELGMPGATKTTGKGYGTMRESVRSVFSHLF